MSRQHHGDSAPGRAGTITDNKQLLAAMMEDTRHAPGAFSIDGPTAAFLDEFHADLSEKGLERMLVEGSKLLNTIGACNFSPLQQMEYNLKGRLQAGEISDDEHRVLSEASRIIFEKSSINMLPYELSMRDLNLAAFRACELYAKETGARPPSELNMAEVAYPEYTFEVDGHRYSYLFLYYYCRYAFCSQFVDFDQLDTVFEVGSGSGRAIEIIKKLHPHLSFHLFDLAPQLYVAHQFLQEIFPDSLVEYDRTRGLESVHDLADGGIHFHPHYHVDRLDLAGKTLSWNTMVFCIMAPHRAARYFDCIRRAADYVYAVEPSTEAGGGQYGLAETMTWEQYESFMAEGFELEKRCRAFRPLAPIRAWGGVDDMFWRRTVPR